MSKQDKVRLSVQGLIAIWLILGLAFHLAAVGLIGLSVIILATTFTGVTDEHAIGKSFQESLPFTALLVVFFSIVAVIIDQKLFGPIIHFVLSAEEKTQLPYSMVSTVYFLQFLITYSLQRFTSMKRKMRLQLGQLHHTNLNYLRSQSIQVQTYLL